MGEEVEGFAAARITGGEGELEARFVPRAGMVCCSLRRRGVELLAQRHGVRAYAERGKTMGVPLLYPWANRLAGFGYRGPDGPVALRDDDPLLTYDSNGLPIHGVLPGALPWELLGEGDPADPAQVRARLRWQRPDLLAVFPWRHEVELRASIEEGALRIETTIHASEDGPRGDSALPVCFGFHPYLAPPGGEREAWEVELPATRHLPLDGRMLPTGASESFTERCFALADTDWDDAFAGLTVPPTFSLSTGEARLEIELLGGYSDAQLYAPAKEPFVCFEPMTAPTNALCSGEGLTRLAPGERYAASFAIRVA